MRNISLKVIPHSKQRYETSGDYWIDRRGTIQIRISKSKNWRHEALLLIYELTEMLLCIDRRVSFKAIDRFDMNFKGDGEPGDDPKAPYYRQHQFATRIERLLAKALRVNWRAYDAGLSLPRSEDLPKAIERAPREQGSVSTS